MSDQSTAVNLKPAPSYLNNRMAYECYATYFEACERAGYKPLTYRQMERLAKSMGYKYESRWRKVYKRYVVQCNRARKRLIARTRRCSHG